MQSTLFSIIHYNSSAYIFGKRYYSPIAPSSMFSFQPSASSSSAYPSRQYLPVLWLDIERASVLLIKNVQMLQHGSVCIADLYVLSSLVLLTINQSSVAMWEGPFIRPYNSNQLVEMWVWKRRIWWKAQGEQEGIAGGERRRSARSSSIRSLLALSTRCSGSCYWHDFFVIAFLVMSIVLMVRVFDG